jgi:hypothetical protein
MIDKCRFTICKPGTNFISGRAKVKEAKYGLMKALYELQIVVTADYIHIIIMKPLHTKNPACAVQDFFGLRIVVN